MMISPEPAAGGRAAGGSAAGQGVRAGTLPGHDPVAAEGERRPPGGTEAQREGPADHRHRVGGSSSLITAGVP